MSNLPQVNVIIPTIGKERMIIDLLQQIAEIDDDVVRQVIVFDNGMDEETAKLCNIFPGVRVIDARGKGIYKMWNMGVKEVLTTFPDDYIAILNDDLQLMTQSFFTKLVEPLDMYEDIWAVCGNYNKELHPHNEDDIYKEVTGTFKDNGFAGFCFAVRANAFIKGLPLFEEDYYWWYGDDDLVHSVHKAGKRTVISLQADMIHIHNGSQTIVQYTPEFNERVAKDRDIYMRKWHSHV